MKLKRIDVRFFRSFNYDYELKSTAGRKGHTWEDTSPAWYPFVRVDIEDDITAIVGANESGKSQLLDAVEAALTGSPIERSDFCRYSRIFSVITGEVRKPEFGGTFLAEATDELPTIPNLQIDREFTLYRPGDDAPFVVQNDVDIELSTQQISELVKVLPTFHRLETDLAIPDSVSIAELIGEPRLPTTDRSSRISVLEQLNSLRSSGSTAEAFGTALMTALGSVVVTGEAAAEERRQAEFRLAKQLLVDVAQVDKVIFEDLRDAIRSGKEGQVEAIVGGINEAIKKNLNVQRWWTQDRDFDLLVEAREHELAFTIRDRTAARYSFGERSQGLRFFLSYFVQLTAHRLKNTKPDILLLDEPDAFLSSVGQNDLLKVLHDYAKPEDKSPQSQIVYVTHSPFLIDKNTPEKIRVLDKGSEREGTRVVRDVANNRYEPLRSSLGAYMAETAFIGGKNLFVEGQADQILLAGISSHVNGNAGSASAALDLNSVTIVAAGGADAIPYMTYLARGRDSVKPPCVALLDGDKAGRDAEKVLKKGEARRKRVLNDDYIVRLDTWASSAGVVSDPGVEVREIEDLIPVDVAHRAALNYLARFVDLPETNYQIFSTENITDKLAKCNGRLWTALSSAFVEAFPDEHLEKAGLAREVVSLISRPTTVPGIESLVERFGALLVHLRSLLEKAAAEQLRDLDDDRVKRAIVEFAKDYTNGIRKYEAQKLIEKIDFALESSDHSVSLRADLRSIADEFELNDLEHPNVPRFEDFRDRVEAFATKERVAYQDDSFVDPVARLSPEDMSADGPLENRTEPAK